MIFDFYVTIVEGDPDVSPLRGRGKLRGIRRSGIARGGCQEEDSRKRPLGTRRPYNVESEHVLLVGVVDEVSLPDCVFLRLGLDRGEEPNERKDSEQQP